MHPAQMQPPGYPWLGIREHFFFWRLDPFVREIIDDMRRRGGKSMKDLPQNLVHFCFATEPPSRSLLFLSDCVDYLASPHADAESNAVAHALLDCIPAVLRSPFLQPSYQQIILHRAANLFMRLLDATYAKLAVKLVKGFNFSEITLWKALQPPGSSASVVGAKSGPGASNKHHIAFFRQDLAQHVFDLLEDKKTVTAAVDLAMQFRTMGREHFQNEGVLHKILDIGQLPLAEQWAAGTSRAFLAQLVRVLVTRRNLKEACRMVKAHRLHEEFPTIEEQYQEDTLERLMNKQLWPAAINVVKDNKALQERLVARMAREGDADLALEYVNMFGLDPSAAEVQESQLAAAVAVRAATYLQLSLPDSAVLFIDSDERVAEAAALLEGQVLLGLDTEWQTPLANGNGATSGHQPHHPQPQQQAQQSQHQQVSIFQLATRTHALIFDMVALHGDAGLDDLLAKVMASADVIKAGCGIRDDVKMLARSYPEMQAFRVFAGLLDLSKVSHSLDGQPKSLTAIAEACLGKPLDKSMQMSRWDRRPLTQRQLAYAALDAHVAVLIYDSLSSSAGAPTFASDVQRSLFSIDSTKNEGRGSRARNTNRTVYQPSTWI